MCTSQAWQDGNHHRHPQNAEGACLCHSPDGLGHGSAELWLRCAPAWHGRMAATIDTHRMLQVQACATHQMGWGMAQQVASHMG